MRNPRICRKCKVTVPPTAPLGLCPQCLLSLGLGSDQRELLQLTGQPVSPEAQPPAAKSECFGDYDLLERIACGGMGTVYRARQRTLNRTVALKLVSAGVLAPLDIIRRFEAEAEAAASLSHPNIVPIYEIGEHEGLHYFSMELIEGPNLRQELANRGSRKGAPPAANPQAGPSIPHREREFRSYPPREAAQLVITVARAVHYAHQRGVLHRDIKPGNILLDAHRQPHLTDFGLAKLLEKDSALTHTHEVLGTPAYMSPEQARGETREVTVAADIYSLGAVLYELLTGSPPFAGGTSLEIIRKVLSQAPRQPSQLSRTVDRDLETICLKCLEKEPERRYATAEALAVDLERWLGHQPIQARRANPYERALMWGRREPLLAGFVLTLLVVLALGVTGVIWQLHRVDAARTEAARSNEDLRRSLRQMDAIQLQRAEEYMNEERRVDALPRWALVLRNNPSNRIAAERLLSTLSHRRWARPTCPPFAQSNRVTFAIFSTDGKRVATSAADHTAYVWDSATGRKLAGPMVHQGEINMVAFSPDDRWVVTASQDRSARVWDAQTGRPATPPLRQSNDVQLAMFDPHGRWILTTSESVAQLWDVRTGQPVGPAISAGGAILDARFSVDGERIGLACSGNSAEIRRSATGRLEHRFSHANSVWAITFSPNGKWLATASEDMTARVWSLDTGQPLSLPLAHSGRVLGVEFSPDSQRVITASADQTAQVWEATSGKKVGPPLLHRGSVRCAMFSPEGLRVVTASHDNSARVWDAWSGEPLTEPMQHDAAVFGAQFSPDGQRVLTSCNGNTAQIWDITGNSSMTFRIGPRITSLHVSHDGTRAVVVSEEGTTRVWDTLTGKPLTPPLPHGSGEETLRVRDAVFSPDATKIATVAEDGTAWIWNANDGELLIGPMRNTEAAELLTFSHDGTRLLATSAHGASVWDVTNGAQMAKILLPQELEHRAIFGPTDRELLTVTKDGTVRVWDSRTGQATSPPLKHPQSVSSAQLSPDGTSVLTTAGDSTFFVWEKATGRQREGRWLHRSPINNAVYNRSGTRVLTSSDQYGAQIWDTRHVSPLSGEIGWRVNARNRHAWYAQGETRLLITYRDNASQFWDTDTGQRLTEILPQTKRLRKWQTPACEGPMFVAASEDGEIKVWETPSVPTPVPPWLPELAEALAGQRFSREGVIDRLNPTELWAQHQRIAEWIHTAQAQRNGSAGPQRSSAKESVTGFMSDASSDPFYPKWAKWFVAKASERTVLPSSSKSLADYAAQLSQEPSLRSAKEALQLAPTDGLYMASLVRQCGAQCPWPSACVEWLARRATELGPGHATTWWTYANWLLEAHRCDEALSIMTRAEPLVLNNPKYYNDLGEMLSRCNRWEEAVAALSRSIELTSYPSNNLRQLRRDAFAGRGTALARLGRNKEAYHDLLARGWVPPRPAGLGIQSVDLGRYYNESPFELAVEYQLSEPPTQFCFMDGVEFDLRGCIHLAGVQPQAQPGIRHPGEAQGIPVNATFRKLHFLHSTKQAAADGEEVAYYVLHFSDETAERIPVVYGEHLRALTTRLDPVRRASAAKEVWPRSGLQGEDFSRHWRFFATIWNNRRPEIKVRSIDFVAAKTSCEPVLIALTLDP